MRYGADALSQESHGSARVDGLELRLFGPPEVHRAGTALRFDTRKAVALLAYLSVTGEPLARERAATLLWPGADHARARASLRRTLSVMGSVGPALRTERGAVLLDADLVSCDVVEFRRAADGADEHDWARAAALVRGDFLAGFSLRDSPTFEDWHLATADSLRDIRSRLLARMMRASVARGELDRAREEARQRLDLEPLSEPAHADLIRLTALTGDRPGALRLYRALVRVLDRELGIGPLPMTVALHDAIRADRLEPVPQRVESAARAPSPAHRTERRSPIPLVARDHEVERLRALWRAAASRGVVVGLVAEPGAGRTALADDLAAWVTEQGGSVLVVRAHAAERCLPFAAAADLVRAISDVRSGPWAYDREADDPRATLTPPAGATVPVIESSAALRRLFESVREALSAVPTAIRGQAQQPALLVVDDADLLDPSSAELLSYVTRRQPRGLLTVVTWTTSGGYTALPTAVREVAQDGGVLHLRPLDLEGVRALLGQLHGADHAPETVLRRTGGVPLLVVEHAAQSGGVDPAGTVPVDLRALVAARLDAAPPVTQQLVVAAAVIGTTADPELLRLTCGRDKSETVDAIEEAVSRQLLVERPEDGGYALPHDMLGDVCLDRTSLARARLLHGRVAGVLERRHAVNPLAVAAGAVAHHLAGAGREAEAAGWFWTAAQGSMRLFAHGEAAAQLGSALALGHDPIACRTALGEVLLRQGRYREAVVELEQAAAAAEHDPGRLTAVEHLLARVHDRLGDWDLAVTYLRSALDLIPPDRHAHRARLLADLALLLHRQQQGAEAMTWAQAARAESDVGDDVVARAVALNVLGLVAGSVGDVHAAIDHLEAAVLAARRVGSRDVLAAALNNLALVLAQDARLDDALLAAEEALEMADELGDLHLSAALHSRVADLLHARGREEDAIAHLHASASGFASLEDAESSPRLWTLTEW